MQDIEPFFNWRHYYIATNDRLSPFYGVKHSLIEHTTSIYNYYIHPQWDYFGSDTLYVKLLYVNYLKKDAIIELIGEWNDAITNDIMHLKRNVIDLLIKQGIKKFLLIGENVLNFHGSDDSYYEEWFQDIEEGWIITIGFPSHILNQWEAYNIHFYFTFDEKFEKSNWRTYKPQHLIQEMDLLNKQYLK